MLLIKAAKLFILVSTIFCDKLCLIYFLILVTRHLWTKQYPVSMNIIPSNKTSNSSQLQLLICANVMKALHKSFSINIQIKQNIVCKIAVQLVSWSQRSRGTDAFKQNKWMGIMSENAALDEVENIVIENAKLEGPFLSMLNKVHEVRECFHCLSI